MKSNDILNAIDQDVDRSFIRSTLETYRRNTQKYLEETISIQNGKNDI